MEEMFLLPTTGWVGKTFIEKVLSSFRFVPGFIFSLFLVWRKKVFAIFNTGAFVSLPISIAGIFLRVPIFTLILDSKPGKAATLLSHFSKEIFLPYEGTFPLIFGKKKTITGIPLREEILKGNPEEALKYFSLKKGKKTLLIIGGSRGARFLAQLAEKLIPLMGKNWQFIVQRGEFNLKIKSKLLREFPFIDRMDLAYSISDVIIGRAGAITIAEIEALGIPAILIPYPFAASDHQFYNAKRLASRRKNIVVIREKEVVVEDLPELIEKLYLRKEPPKENSSAQKIAERISNYVWKI